MHELSVALSLVEVACEAAGKQAAGARIEAVHLRLGPLSGVVAEALRFSFELAAAGTPLAGARLEIEESPVVVHCPACDADRELPSLQRFRCPVCDTLTPDVVAGRELELTALEVEDDDTDR